MKIIFKSAQHRKEFFDNPAWACEFRNFISSFTGWFEAKLQVFNGAMYYIIGEEGFYISSSTAEKYFMELNGPRKDIDNISLSRLEEIAAGEACTTSESAFIAKQLLLIRNTLEYSE